MQLLLLSCSGYCFCGQHRDLLHQKNHSDGVQDLGHSLNFVDSTKLTNVKWSTIIVQIQQAQFILVQPLQQLLHFLATMQLKFVYNWSMAIQSPQQVVCGL